MKFLWKTAKFLLRVIGLFCCLTAFVDRRTLDEQLVRLHVVGASNSEEDQAEKLQVRDAVLNVVQEAMEAMPDAAQARAFLADRLEELEQAANAVLEQAGSPNRARVSLEKEAFPTREYDSFTLPAGVYEALRVTIGPGEGKNWWCVVFPSLCMAQDQQEFSDAAAGAGFSQGLSNTLQEQEGYELRFFLLDCLGWLENLFYR